MDQEPTVLTLNAGSSSLKFAVFAGATPPRKLFSGTVNGVGGHGGELSLGAPGERLSTRALEAADHAHALAASLDELARRGLANAFCAVGHRIVHGGPKFGQSVRISDEVLRELAPLGEIDPDHMPAELGLIRAVRTRWPELPQIACFDTAFHHALPRVARLLAIPRRYEAAGMRRYGFHGLSYTYLLEELGRVAAREARGKVVLAHLGAGSSLSAVRDGQPLDTTMGFTPTSGIMMATRSGDLDPGVLIRLGRSERMDIDALDDLVNRRSGLLGVSGSSSSLKDLLAREAKDARAAEAIALYCYQAKKAVGALAAVLGGADTIVFSGGIGERAASVRAWILQGLDYLGVALDDTRNAEHAPIISSDRSACVVRVIPTDEESVIAADTLRTLGTTERRARL